MAVKASIRPIVRTISQAVGAYAQRLGLLPGDYALVGTFDERTDRIRLTFATDRKIDELQWFSGILEEIRRSFPSFPEITMYISLVVESVRALDEIYYDHVVGEDDTDLADLLERS